MLLRAGLSTTASAAATGEPATFWIYGAIVIGAFAFVYFLMPETKGRSLEQIEADLRGKASPQA